VPLPFVAGPEANLIVDALGAVNVAAGVGPTVIADYGGLIGGTGDPWSIPAPITRFSFAASLAVPESGVLS
jgi:hypothetical protein